MALTHASSSLSLPDSLTVSQSVAFPLSSFSLSVSLSTSLFPGSHGDTGSEGLTPFLLQTSQSVASSLLRTPRPPSFARSSLPPFLSHATAALERLIAQSPLLLLPSLSLSSDPIPRRRLRRKAQPRGEEESAVSFDISSLMPAIPAVKALSHDARARLSNSDLLSPSLACACDMHACCTKRQARMRVL